ncbi:MAG: 3TM-type holin [Tabrizicola sp.]|jgi:hypothetical protein|nr:3TM-type holin [Tabrizicola sp.]
MSALVALALQAGFPIIRSVLEGKLGGKNGGLVADVLGAVAGRAGVQPEALEGLAVDSPGKVIEAMRQVEPMTPELVALYAKGLEHQNALLMAEQEEGGWKAAWRPLGMYFVMVLWAWQVVILHVCNAIWKIALPPMPYDQLVTFTGLYMGLYMGGHTLKDMAAKWVGAKK